jgi:hypothetical protein
MSFLDDVLRGEDEQPTPHRREQSRAPSRYRFLIRPTVIALIGAVLGGLFLRASGVAVPYPLIFMILLTLQLLRRALRWIDPRPVPDGLRRSAGLTTDDGSAPPDGLQLAVSRWDTRLSWVRLQHDLDHFARTVQPRLIQLVDERLRLRHGVVRAADPQRARALLGDPLWTFVTQPTRSDVTPANLAALISLMEEL